MLKKLLPMLVVVELCVIPFAEAKRDFKGMFGSYRRERFTENEANSSDFGMDLILSTMLPISTIASSSEDKTNYTSMAGSTFFNVEANLFFTVNYNWQIFGRIGWYTYETRKQNSTAGTNDPGNNERPIFHQFEMTSAPLMLGAKYRFNTEDIVPYVGAAAGVSIIRRQGFYDYSTERDVENITAFTAEILGGFEFYITSRMGIRLEGSIQYVRMAARTLNFPAASLPAIVYEGNPITMRYASGLFILF